MNNTEYPSMKISHNIVEHLGLKLYQNKPTNVIAELVSNSWDANANRLNINIINKSDKKYISIEDNGCGIKASDLSRVFEKGFTGSNRNKANATGMGLYLSKKLCDRLGLKLDIASTEKEYTRLTITFPKGTVHNFSE